MRYKVYLDLFDRLQTKSKGIKYEYYKDIEGKRHILITDSNKLL